MTTKERKETMMNMIKMGRENVVFESVFTSTKGQRHGLQTLTTEDAELVERVALEFNANGKSKSANYEKLSHEMQSHVDACADIIDACDCRKACAFMIQTKSENTYKRALEIWIKSNHVLILIDKGLFSALENDAKTSAKLARLREMFPSNKYEGRTSKRFIVIEETSRTDSKGRTTRKTADKNAVEIVNWILEHM